MTKYLFLAFVLLLALQRVAELRLSRRNETWISAQGGREHAAVQFRVMKAIHAMWFVAMLAEVFLLRRPFIPALSLASLLALALGQALRYAAIRTLGLRWSVRVFTLPGAPPVNKGIYRYLRHPNYLGVILEIAAVPLLHTAYLTAFVFSLLNGLVLWGRIRVEEAALRQENGYEQVFAGRPRFLPFSRGSRMGRMDEFHE